MQVGSLGNIIFSVSANKVQTVRSLTHSGSANFGTLQRHSHVSLIEFVGTAPDTLTLNIRLSEQLGANVMGEINKIEDAQQNGKTLKLVIGKTVMGRYRWVISKYSVKPIYYDKCGNVTAADVTLNLTEYIKE